MRMMMRTTVGVLLGALAATAASAAPDAAEPTTKVAREGPLAGLPSAPGPHIEKIRALDNNEWVNLGAPAPDPKWGRAPGRSWCCTMPFDPRLRGAFLYGEGQHGHVKPNGRYMDDCWFYDLNGHRWICVYPGTDVKNPGLTRDAEGFPVDQDGRRTPVSLCVHAYDLLTWDSDQHRLMIMGTHEYCFAPKTLKALLPPGGKVPPSSPWMYDPATGRWDVRRVDGPSPEKAEGTLLYLPGMKKVFYRSGKGGAAVWFYDPARNSWTRVMPQGPRPPFGIDPTACYDPKRERIYIGGGSYPSVEEGKNALWIYDLKADAWIDPQPKATPLSHFATTYATMRYDPVADVVIVAAHAEKKRGIHVYDPAANAWRAPTLSFPEEFPKKCVNGFYDPDWNVHVFHVAGDSRPDGRIWAYRYKRAEEKPAS